MISVVTISPKGRFTVPKWICKELGLNKPQKLHMEVRGKQLVFSKINGQNTGAD